MSRIVPRGSIEPPRKQLATKASSPTPPQNLSTKRRLEAEAKTAAKIKKQKAEPKPAKKSTEKSTKKSTKSTKSTKKPTKKPTKKSITKTTPNRPPTKKLTEAKKSSKENSVKKVSKEVSKLGHQMVIYVKHYDGDVLEFHLSDFDTIGHLRELILDQGVYSEFRLIWIGRPMRHVGRTLHDYSLHNGSTIYLVKKQTPKKRPKLVYDYDCDYCLLTTNCGQKVENMEDATSDDEDYTEGCHVRWKCCGCRYYLEDAEGKYDYFIHSRCCDTCLDKEGITRNTSDSD